jgi:hypothetical protein
MRVPVRNAVVSAAAVVLVLSSALFILTRVVRTNTTTGLAAGNYVDVKVPRLGTRDLILPEASEVEAIVAEVYQHPLRLPDVAPFRLTESQFPSVLQFFKNAEIDKKPYPETCFSR